MVVVHAVGVLSILHTVAKVSIGPVVHLAVIEAIVFVAGVVPVVCAVRMTFM